MQTISYEFDEPISDEACPVPRAPAGGMIRLIGGLASMLAGFGILLGGLILHFAEKAGKVTILPMPIAGRLTAVIGLSIVGLGAWLARRRAAMAFSVFVVVGGLVLYAFGLAYRRATRLADLPGARPAHKPRRLDGHLGNS